MKHYFSIALVLVMALSGMHPEAHTGPLLDKLKERRAAKSSEGDGRIHNDVKMLGDVAYGSDARQRMDVYLPATKPSSGLSPVIVMVHGGGWRTGDKRHDKVVDNKVARWVSRGFVLISVNNRLLPEANPLEQARDIAKALAFAQTQAAGWGADPAQFVLMGHSAGAHLVAMLAASSALVKESGAAPWLGTVALDSAAMDMTTIMQSKHYGLYDPAFGTDPELWRATSPCQQLAADARPMAISTKTWVCRALTPMLWRPSWPV